MSVRWRAIVRREDSERAPSVEAVRLQLEGRLEVLEAARARYVRLRRALSLWGWERRLRRRPELVREVLLGEPAYTEALERVLRRAESEGWSEDAPGLALVRDVRAQRARLEKLVRERLDTRVWTTGTPSLVDDLERLELIALQRVWLERRRTPSSFGLGGVVGETLVYLGQLAGELAGPLGLLLLVAGGLLILLASALGLGRVVWRMLGVKFEVDPVDVAQAEHLSAVLEIRRRWPSLISRSQEGRLSQVVCFPATLWAPNGSEQVGHAVLRADVLTFLPEGTAPGMLRALAGPDTSPLPVRVEVPWLVEQLRHLSGADFDTSLARAAEAVGGRRWEVGSGSNLGLNGVQLHFARDGYTLRGTVTGPALKAAARLVFTPRW
jgi:hypothetical protein